MTPNELLQKIEGVDPGNDKDFHEIVFGALSLGLVSERDLAHEFGASLSTVERWKTGQNWPHPKLRPPIYRYLWKVLQKNKR